MLPTTAVKELILLSLGSVFENEIKPLDLHKFDGCSQQLEATKETRCCHSSEPFVLKIYTITNVGVRLGGGKGVCTVRTGSNRTSPTF
jgi:hypothetical protein